MTRLGRSYILITGLPDTTKGGRIVTLSTAKLEGDVNVAVFGFPRMTDERTAVMGIGTERLV